MVDMCHYCNCREDIKLCESCECAVHDSWYAKELRKLPDVSQCIASIESDLAAGPTYDYNETPDREDIRKVLRCNAMQARAIETLKHFMKICRRCQYPTGCAGCVNNAAIAEAGIEL